MKRTCTINESSMETEEQNNPLPAVDHSAHARAEQHRNSRALPVRADRESEIRCGRSRENHNCRCTLCPQQLCSSPRLAWKNDGWIRRAYQTMATTAVQLRAICTENRPHMAQYEYENDGMLIQSSTPVQLTENGVEKWQLVSTCMQNDGQVVSCVRNTLNAIKVTSNIAMRPCIIAASIPHLDENEND